MEAGISDHVWSLDEVIALLDPASMPTKSLKSRIDKLINSLGGTDKPGLPEIRSELVTFAQLAEALEDNQATREAEAKIAVLEAALEKSNAENSNLKIKLQTANAEIQRFRAERKKQEEKEREIPPIQFQILKRVPNEHGGGSWLGINEISRAVNIPPDEAEIHVDRLEKAGLVTRRYNAYDALVWHRSMPGNELVLAKRLAGEEEEQETYKYPDLPKIQHDALLMIVGEDEGINEREIAKRLGNSLALAQHTLSLLRDADFATDGDEADYGTGRTWVILRKGNEYLAERNLL
jgi:DNA-binding transcriptional ArsR family regulator